MNFTRHLEDVKESSITTVLVDPETNEENNASVNLQILQFVTGAAEIPPLGFKNQPRVVFNHVDPEEVSSKYMCSSAVPASQWQND